MDNPIHFFFLHQFVKSIEIADVHFHKPVIRLVLDILQICKVPRIGQLVQVDNPVFGIFVHKKTDNMASNKTGATGNDNGFLHRWKDT